MMNVLRAAWVATYATVAIVVVLALILGVGVGILALLLIAIQASPPISQYAQVALFVAVVWTACFFGAWRNN